MPETMTNGHTTEPDTGQRDVIADAARAIFRRAATATGYLNSEVRRAVAAVGRGTATGARSLGTATAKAVQVANERASRAWFARLLILPGFFFVCVNFNAEGFRNSIEFTATPLSKLPLLSALADFEETRRIDVAVITALGVMTVVWFLFERLVGLYLRSPKMMTNEEKLAYYVGLPMLVADSWMFFKGVYGGGLLGGSGDDFLTAGLLTVLYAGSIVVCAWGVHLIRYGTSTRETT